MSNKAKSKDEKKAPSEIDIYVGLQIRAARREIELTQDGLGNLLGITFQQVQKYERGVNRVSSGKLYEIAGVLKRPIAYFYPQPKNDNDYDEDPIRAENLRCSDLRKECKAALDDVKSPNDLGALKLLITRTAAA